ncbi:MAG TPA: hypothetical protein VG734_24090 [Lacunisphaera sp.]|nr:hypothetical protein [Lacunisphaera sp.]
MNPPPPRPATFPARRGSILRAGAYLRLCGLSRAEVEKFADCPIEELQGRLDAWATRLVPPEPSESAQQHAARGRAQLLLARVPGRWPAQFLDPSPPPELAEAVQAEALRPRRPMRPASMAPQDLDLGPVSDVAQETWRTFDKWPVLRGITLWLLFSLLLLSVFYVVRF